MHRWVPLCLALAISFAPNALAQNWPAGFYTEEIAQVGGAMSLDFAPDGRIFVITRGGQVRVIEDGTLLPIPFLDLSAEVATDSDRGFTSFAIDPNFASNRFVYCFYSSTDGWQKLVRYQASAADPNVADPASRAVLIGQNSTDGWPLQQAPNIHVNGSLRFADDGSLFISHGDNSDNSGNDPDIYWVQDLDVLAGKILRVDPMTGNGYPDNPFYTGDPTDKRSKVWAYGLRNPFRFTIRPANPFARDAHPRLYIGDVGWNTYEELNVAAAPGMNFGWPCYEGPNANPAYIAGAVCNEMGATADNPSPPAFPAAAWGHNFGSSSMGGDFYVGGKYPAEYFGRYFHYDYASGWMKTFDVDAADNISNETDFSDGMNGIVEWRYDAATQYFYFCNIGAGTVNRLRHLDETDNVTPNAIAAASETAGYAPFTVSFDGSGSYDLDGDALTYSWNFGDGEAGSGATTSHTYTSNGTFAATLTVSDGTTSDSAVISISVGNTPPVPTILSPTNGDVARVGDTINLNGTATDNDQAGGLTYNWRVDTLHNDHVHPGLFTATGPSASFTFTEHGVAEDLVYIAVHLDVVDDGGLVGSTTHFVIFEEDEEIDITALGSPFALGPGDVGVIADTVFPPLGSNDASLQYDSRGGSAVSADWVGYTFGESRLFSRLVFQEGIHQADGGWFDTIDIQVRSNGLWRSVEFFTSVLPYAGNDGVNFGLYNLLFEPVIGDAIRLQGDPGGSANFVSVAELRVIAFAGEYGLNATYYNNINFSGAELARVDPQIDFNWGNGAPDASMGGNTYSVRWQGFVVPDFSDTYTFHTTTDDGVRLWVDGQLIVDQWIDQAPMEWTGNISLAAGVPVPVTMEYYENGGGAMARLEWSSTNQPREVVPANSLLPTLPGEGPMLSSFTPPSGRAGDAITISGTRLSGAYQVTIDGLFADDVTVVSDSEVRATAPVDVRTGRVRVSTPGGSSTSNSDFVVLGDPPTIASFTPTSGLVGETVSIFGDGFADVSAVTFNGVAAPSFTFISAGEVRATVPSTDTGPIAITTPNGTGTSSTSFVIEDDVPVENGLLAEYYDSIDFTNLAFERIDPVVNFAWGGGTPAPGMGDNTFSIRWTGYVLPERTERFTFHTITDDGVRLWVNDQLLIDKWVDQGAREWTGEIDLVAGAGVSVRMEYYENTGGAYASLYWSSESSPTRTIIPNQNLFTAPPTGTVGPYILAYSPTSGAPGDDITITGGNFVDVSSVTFAGTSATYTVTSESEIVAQVPADATNGPIGVTTAGGSTETGGDFLVTGDDPPSENGLYAEYYDSIDFTNLAIVRVDPTVDFAWGGGEPDPSMGGDTFSVRWTGYVLPERSETYTFHTVTDDGVRLWVNDQLLIDKWIDQGAREWTGDIALNAGQLVSIRMEYYENRGGAYAALYWSSPSVSSRTIIPNQNLFTAPDDGPPRPYISSFTPASGAPDTDVTITGGNFTGVLAVTFGGVSAAYTVDSSAEITAQVPLDAVTGPIEVVTNDGTANSGTSFVVTDGTVPAENGLFGEYFDNQNLTNLFFSRVDPVVDFSWGGGSPDPGMADNTYSVRWTGFVRADRSETYTFHTVTDDGVRLWVNDLQIIDKWVDQGAREWTGTMAMTAGELVPIRMEYYQAFGGSTAELYWSSPGAPSRSIIPEGNLFTTSTDDGGGDDGGGDDGGGDDGGGDDGGGDPADGLVAHYTFSEGTGTTAADSSPFGNDGVLGGGAGWTADGAIGGGLTLDGVDGRVTVASDPSLDITDNLTLAAWIHVPEFQDWDGIITKGQSRSPWALQTWGSGALRFTANWGGPPGHVGRDSWNSTSSLSTNTWHHVAVTYDGATVRFYIDGQPDPYTHDANLVFGTMDEPLTVGADFPGAVEYLNGRVDDARVYNRALTASEIVQVVAESPLARTRALVPADFLLGAYPNPFNPVTTINYALPIAAHAQLMVFNPQGQLVTTLVNEPLAAGFYRVRWDGRNERKQEVASGVYFLRMRAGDTEKLERLILLK